MSRRELTIERVDRIAEVDCAGWARVAANDVYAQHGWLRVVEDTVAEASRPIYFLAFENGDLQGAAVCYRFDRGASPSSLERQLFGRLAAGARRLGGSLSPALYCGPLMGQGRYLLWRRDLAADDVDALLGALLDEICAFASAERLLLAVGKLPTHETSVVRALAGRRFIRTLNWPVSYIDLEWPDFDAYVTHLGGGGSSMATKVRREVAGPAKSGFELERGAALPHRDAEIFELIRANLRAHSRLSIDIAPKFLQQLQAWHAGQSVVSVATSSDGALAGAALLLTAGERAAGPLIGVSDDERNRKAFTYFNLAFYTPIKYCIEHGIKRLELGAGLYEMKRRRGCRELEIALFIRPRTMLGRLFWRLACAVHRAWVIAKLRGQGVRIEEIRGPV
jgi:predicted N-acyltransferase